MKVGLSSCEPALLDKRKRCKLHKNAKPSDVILSKGLSGGESSGLHMQIIRQPYLSRHHAAM